MLWDLDSRPHEVILLKIKHIRHKKKYGERKLSLFSHFLAVKLFANAFASLPSFWAYSASLSKAFVRSFSFLEAEFNAKESLIIAIEAIISERIVIAIKNNIV